MNETTTTTQHPVGAHVIATLTTGETFPGTVTQELDGLRFIRFNTPIERPAPSEDIAGQWCEVDALAAVDAWHARLRGIAAAANRPARPVYGQAGRWS